MTKRIIITVFIAVFSLSVFAASGSVNSLEEKIYPSPQIPVINVSELQPVALPANYNAETCRLPHSAVMNVEGVTTIVAQDPAKEDETTCHNDSKKDKKNSTACKCWGKGDPKRAKCPPPNGEDPQCTKHCRPDLCHCKVKCQS